MKKRYKFIGTKKESEGYGKPRPKKGKLYKGDKTVGNLDATRVSTWAKIYPLEWEEVKNYTVETKIVCEDTQDYEYELRVLSNRYKANSLLFELAYNFWRNWKHDESKLNLTSLMDEIDNLFSKHNIDQNEIT